ncbi:MAG: hypothetical protein NZ602_01180 [Thermoguttaceae bacterium]|nr:hypothetical protein [Thermoguttaceae bacterium]MDW8037407.1 hypothetical protein [Thermoguttaceae bacterium]
MRLNCDEPNCVPPVELYLRGLMAPASRSLSGESLRYGASQG